MEKLIRIKVPKYIRSKKMKNKSVVVVLPIYQKKFDKNEILSLIQLRKKLFKKYDICIVTREDLSDTIKREPLLQGYGVKYLAPKFYDYQGYNLMCKSVDFYSYFKEYEYMLIYHTDALVFGNLVTYWTKKKYDYVGPPWFNKDKNGKLKLLGTGNGGISLRKIDSFIAINQKAQTCRGKIILFIKNILPSIPVLFHKALICRDYPRYHIGSRNEDLFYAYAAKQLNSNFKVAGYQDSLKFAFEKYPEYCFKENKNKLPFACHAFQKYNNLNFWLKKLK